MHVKAEVRKRRHDRIRQIQEGHKGYPDKQLDWHRADPRQNEEIHPIYPSSDPRLNDPEYLWKREGSHRWDLPDHPGWTMKPIYPRREPLFPPAHRFVWGKMIFCALLFGLIWGMFQIHQPWAIFGQGYVKSALTESYDFTAIAAWYENTFKGAPSFLPALNLRNGSDSQKVNVNIDKIATFHRPLPATIKVPYSNTHLGLILETKKELTAEAIDTGWVIYVGNTARSGLTVVVQHARGYTSEYGLLGQTELKKNDWVENGDAIGITAADATTHKGKLYFAMAKDGQYINPADVVKFD